MIRLDVEQGSKAWLDARLGIPTASQYHRIITPKTLKPSSSQSKYRAALMAEQLLGVPLDDATTAFMQRGALLERSAISYYELTRDVEVERVGFIYRDDGLTGCSPDGLVGEDGGLELKCPSAEQHVAYMLGDEPDQYNCQVQGAMWLTGRKWWDWLSYHPDLPPVLMRFARDESFIRPLAAEVERFIAYCADGRKLLKQGYYRESDLPARVA